MKYRPGVAILESLIIMTGLRIFVRGTEEVKIKISKCDFEKFLSLELSEGANESRKSRTV